MFLKVIRNFALCYMVGIIFTFPVCLFATESAPQGAIKDTDIPNHHIFYRQDKRAPLTNIEIVFFGAGRTQEPPSKNGLAETASKLIRESAKKQGYQDQWVSLGTKLDISIDTISLKISISALSENCGKSIEIVRDLIQNLEFSESDLQETKKQQADYYQRYLQTNTYSLMKSFALAKTKGIKKYKSLKTLKNLSLEDLKQYYTQLLKTDVVFFKVTSDRDSIEIAKWLHPITEERETGGFVYSLKYPTTDYSVGHTAFVFNRSRVKNIVCYWLIPCGRIGEAYYIPAMISKTLMQNINLGLLNAYFREELGLVYNIHCNPRSFENVRITQIFADPLQHNSEELIVKMSNFILRLSDNPRFWEALKERRRFYYHSVTDAEVRDYLEKFFVPENMIMIFVGPKDHIIDILNKHMPEVDIHVHSVKELIE